MMISFASGAMVPCSAPQSTWHSGLKVIAEDILGVLFIFYV